jgi:uncharacterized protein
MKSNAFEMCLLFDYYGEMLTEKQRKIFDLYYNEDLSLSEISENIDITRQGVRDTIVRAESTLRDMELKLGFASRFSRLTATLKNVDNDAGIIVDLGARGVASGETEKRARRIKELISPFLQD